MSGTQAREIGVQSPLRILYVISALRTVRAGTEGHLLRLLKHLDRTLFEPHLAVLQESPGVQHFRELEIPVQVLGFQSFKRLRDWRCIGQLASSMRRTRPQIVELHFTDAHFVGALAARLAGVPSVVSCRRDLGHQYGRKELLLNKLGNRFVTRFLANSRAVVRRMGELEGLPAERFDVIPNGIDLPLYDRQAREDPLDSFIRHSRGKRVVAVVANLRPVKNHSGLLRAVQRVCREVDDVVFVMIGDGSLGSSLQERAAELQVSDRILWLGSVAAPAAYLTRSHIGCLASHSEGFSNAILEYMAGRLPVVATRVGGAEEAVLEGDTGLLVDPGDMDGLGHQLVALLRDPTLSRRMGASGRAAVERDFTLQAQLIAYQRFCWKQQKGAL